MTRIEKEVVIRALSEYSNKCKRKAERERNRGEFGKASSSQSECSTASAVMMAFCTILTEPAGSVKI